MITEKQVEQFIELIESFVESNYSIEDLCDRCADSAYIIPDHCSVYKKRNKELLLKINGILKLNTLKGFIKNG